jgi:hypothetical protein
MTNDDEDRDSTERNEEVDSDTSLILDYLSNKLDGDAVRELEERARVDKEFRYKLADIVLLKGLVTLALERNPDPTPRTCRRTRRMFLDYLRGRTSVSKTAALSRHLDECLECEMAFERLESGASADEGVTGDPRRGRSLFRRVALTGIVAAALVAGAFGIYAFLTSGGAARHGAPAPGTTDSTAGLVPRADGVMEAVAELRGSVAGRLVWDAAGAILDPVTEPMERADLYRQVGRDAGKAAERLLWVFAENEPIEHARAAAYEALAAFGPTDLSRMLAAARRESAARAKATHLLVSLLVARLSDEARQFLRELLAASDGRQDEWSAMVLRASYAAMRNDPPIERHMASCLAHADDRVRAIAAVAAADAGHGQAMPIALELFDSRDATARFHAIGILRRHGTEEQFRRLLSRDWSRDEDTRLAIESAMRSRGFDPPKHP